MSIEHTDLSQINIFGNISKWSSSEVPFGAKTNKKNHSTGGPCLKWICITMVFGLFETNLHVDKGSPVYVSRHIYYCTIFPLIVNPESTYCHHFECSSCNTYL